jgi:DNA-binding IclR family transcriptional regulator
MDDSWRTIDAVRTSLRIATTLANRGGAGVSEVAESLDCAPSTVHAHLKTMEDEGFVVHRNAEYHPGLRFLDVGGAVAVERPGYDLATRKVSELAAETGERVQFVAEEGGRGYYLHTDTGDRAVQIDARVGKRNYLHASAAGKAILAALPEKRVDSIVAEWGLPALTDDTITTREELDAELARVRERGYAVNDGESIPGLRAVGVAVRDGAADVVGALSVSGPSNRMREEWGDADLTTRIRGIANELELTIQHG